MDNDSTAAGECNAFAVVASELTKVYSGGAQQPVRALDGVDLVVHPGEFACVMGPSGSGKSTLLHVLTGLVRPTSGSVRIGQVEMHRLRDAEAARFRRRNVGLVFQFFNLIPTLNVAENIALTLLLEGKRLGELTDQIAKLSSFLGIADRLDHFPASLSGGEMQRVAIARSLLAEPKVMLADEPTGNLDSRAGEEVLSYFRRICDRHGVTTLVVTHDLRACSYADRIVVLQDGRIADDVPAREFGGTE